MGLLNDKNKNALIDLSDMIDPNSIDVNIFDNTILTPFIKEASSEIKKLPIAMQQSYAHTKILFWINENGYSWIFSLNGLSKFAAAGLRLKGTKSGKVYGITSQKSKDPLTHEDKLCVYFGQMLCVVKVVLKQDIPNIDGFVKIYKDGTFKYGQ